METAFIFVSKNASEAILQDRFPAAVIAQRLKQDFLWDVSSRFVVENFRGQESAEFHHFGPNWEETTFFDYERICSKITSGIERWNELAGVSYYENF